MRKAVLTAALASLAMWAQAAPPPETVATRIETVSPASRKFVADGLTWALSSTAAVRVPGKARASLRDIRPGMNVRLVLVPTDGEVPVVSSITVLPD
jgi:multidrug efflux pump subunit AcrA (membrane-fusion protein)